MDLFDAQGADALARRAPLAERLRPKNLDEVVGQDHLTGPGAPLRTAVENGRIGAIVLWGPPGTGKTTLARALAAEMEGEFVPLSAVTSGVKEMRGALDAARERLKFEGRATILFVDEVHRFNKTQQDALLPALEEGLVDFVGATTENPSFELNAALLSRARVLIFKALDEDALRALLTRAEEAEGKTLPLDDDAREALIQMADGDGRAILTLAEEVWRAAEAG
ncbi:MAG: putative ATPase, partial [Rubrobacteraceae bacterium]|nr:putative ATPase [Rubrobacteraceae bacterium]